jgi:hypothetical protein
MELITTTIVGAGGTAQIDLTSIPGTYTDLLLLASLRSEYPTTTAALNVRLNGQVSNVYTGRMIYGNGSSASPGSQTNAYAFDPSIYIQGSSSTSNTFANVAIRIPNYSTSNYKLLTWEAMGEQNGTSAYHGFFSGYWNNTAAITEINLLTNGDFEQYSSVSLYGILKGSGGATVS